MGGDLGPLLQFGALGILAAVLVGVGKGIMLWSKQSGELTSQVLNVVSENSKVIASNTMAISSMHDGLSGLRSDLHQLTLQLASRPCAAEELQVQLDQARAECAQRLGIKEE